MPKFKVVSDFEPAGDQPQAIAAPGRGRRTGATASRRCSASPARARAPPSPGRSSRCSGRRWSSPQQVARRPAGQRVPRVLPREPGRVLRQLLRLLPARGVHPVERHVHREGQLGQRRDRPAAPLGHLGAAHPARHHRRGVGLVHLRPGLARGVRGPAARRADRRGARPALDPRASSSTCSTSATT